MPDARIRQQIALLAARLMYDRSESEYFTAKRKAARQLGLDYRFKPHDLPSNAEIREHIQLFARLQLRLTATGERTLRGEADRVELLGIDRWIGGTHITPDNTWRWHPTKRKLVRPSRR